ncbi:hypothetical protein TanjilG_09184 [Lupinus angustifolius]|uniref:Glutathione reductase n=1 Tax=Lupinus angustifolius TaxID=3871 RepID=A0A394DF15_LUPAN|nr:hypothetical protein TanjilG_09184 [Lupinus angustifolius]
MARKMLIDSEIEEGTNFDFDLFVIGAGSGGVRAARFSASFGAKVGVCELPFHPISSETIGGVGGTCVIRGCVPKKILVYGSSFGSDIEDARNYGWELSEKVDFNWKKLLEKKTNEINRLNGIYKRMLSNAGVKLFEGEGKIVGPNEVEVTQLDGTKLSYSAKHILIATGSRAQVPNIPGQELGITSDEALSLEEFPKRAVILGGGYIAVEFASIWQGMGSTVSLVFRKELPLRGFDDEMRAVVARNLEARGVILHPRTNLTQLIKTDDGIKVITDHGEELVADVVLFATAMARKMLIDSEIEEGTNFDFDLFVIGAGSGGVRAARFSASFGAKVGVCELPFHPISSETIGGVGGTCVIRGCVPKKILVYGSSFGSDIEDARNYGWELSEKVDFNWKKLLEKKTNEINRLNGIYKRMLSNAGVKLFEGEGKIVGPNEVEVTQLDGTKLSYSAKHILIATGSRAQVPNIPGQELGITSDEALSLEEFPKRAVILGGGYIAVEFASIWQGMGSTVSLVFRKELPLRGFDDEMRAVVARNLEARGVILHPRTNLTQLIKTDDGIKVITDHGEELVADVVLFATGRAPNTKRLNLEAVGVELDNTGAIKVDEYSRTNIPSIWAVGDVTNRFNLTPVALMEGTCFAKTVFGSQPSKPDYSNIPYAVFSIPPLSVVGLSEEQAIEQANGDLLVFTSSFNPMRNTISGRQEKTVMKLVVDAETDKVLGASMCGPDAPEIMQAVYIRPPHASLGENIMHWAAHLIVVRSRHDNAQ